MTIFLINFSDFSIISRISKLLRRCCQIIWRVYPTHPPQICYYWLQVAEKIKELNLITENWLCVMQNLGRGQKYNQQISKLSGKKSNLHYICLIPFRVSRVSGVHLRDFAPELSHQGCSGGVSLATCGRFDRIGIWIPYRPY